MRPHFTMTKFKYSPIAVLIVSVLAVLAFVYYGMEKADVDQRPPNVGSVSLKGFAVGRDSSAVLADTIKQANAGAHFIHQRYEMDFQPWQNFFMMIWNLPEHAWEIIRLKFAVKMIQGMLSGNSPPKFTMIFTGSSVTAGHDSFYDKSYVGIIEERLAVALASAGIQLDLRNVAQPGFGCMSNNYCFSGMAMTKDEVVDFISWENTFACGNSNAAALEYFARLAAQHKAVAYYSASGGASMSHCAASEDHVPFASYEWTPESAGITAKYVATPEKLQSYKSRLFAHFKMGNSADNLVRLIQRPYKGIAPHGMSMYARSKQACNYTSILHPKYQSKVPVGEKRSLRRLAETEKVESTSTATKSSNKNSTVAITARKSRPECSANDLFAKMCHHMGGPRFMTKEGAYKANAPGVVQGVVAWNPSIGMHLIRAEIFLYNYFHILLDAAFSLQTDLQALETNVLKRRGENKGQNVKTASAKAPSTEVLLRTQLEIYERKLAQLQRSLSEPLDDPKYCSSWECGNPRDHTRCYTDYQPKYTVDALGKHLSSLSQLLVSAPQKWTKVERHMVAHSKEYGYKDLQVYYQADEPLASISFAVTILRGRRNASEPPVGTPDGSDDVGGIVKIFYATDKAPLDHVDVLLDPSVKREDAVLGVYKPSSHLTVLRRDTDYNVVKGHLHIFGLVAGTHVITLRVKDSAALDAIATKMNADAEMKQLNKGTFETKAALGSKRLLEATNVDTSKKSEKPSGGARKFDVKTLAKASVAHIVTF